VVVPITLLAVAASSPLRPRAPRPGPGGSGRQSRAASEQRAGQPGLADGGLDIGHEDRAVEREGIGIGVGRGGDKAEDRGGNSGQRPGAGADLGQGDTMFEGHERVP
jgi:hypothetical protein